jgi:hypothetical protein
VPLIFSYGSLQQEAVQVSVYGRRLGGEADELVGWVRELIAVPKAHKAAAAGLTHYANVRIAPGSANRVAGTAFELTDAELLRTDGYEQEAGYVRVVAALASGLVAWVYVSAETAAGSETKLE